MSKGFYCNGNKIYVIHVPGDNEKEFKTIARGVAEEKRICVDDDVAIVTTATSDLWDKCFLREQCERGNIPLYNAAKNHDVSTRGWKNPMKIFYIKEALAQVDKKYSLVLDGRDTILTADIDKEFIEKYESLGCDFLFNGTPKAYPVCMENMDIVVHRKGNHRFLNAGVVFGETKKLLNFYTTLWQIILHDDFLEMGSEQRVLTSLLADKVYGKEYSYFVDSESKFFAVLHKEDNIITTDENTKNREIFYRW